MVVRAVGSRGLDDGQVSAGCVDDVQNQRNQIRAHLLLAGAHPAEQRFGFVGQRLKPGKPQKSAGTLDGVESAKHAGQQAGVAGPFFQFHQFVIEPGEILSALNDEFSYDFEIVHACHIVPGPRAITLKILARLALWRTPGNRLGWG
jgi:hypothetical protein